MNKIQKYWWVCFIVAILISGSGFLSQLHSETKAPAARVAIHLVGWTYTLYGDWEAIGFFTFVDGIPRTILDETSPELNPEQRAYFTFRTQGFIPEAEVGSSGGNVKWAQYGPFSIEVFLDTDQNENICTPDSFSDGQLIATLRIVNQQNILVPTTGPDPYVMRITTSAGLESSANFSLPDDKKKYDFKDLIPAGVTFSLFGSDELVYCPPGEGVTQMFAGSALTIETGLTTGTPAPGELPKPPISKNPSSMPELQNRVAELEETVTELVALLQGVSRVGNDLVLSGERVIIDTEQEVRLLTNGDLNFSGNNIGISSNIETEINGSVINIESQGRIDLTGVPINLN